MKLSDFVLQPRGAYNFDHYIHPMTIPSPLGDFSLELYVDSASRRPADQKMLAAIIALRQTFEDDMDSLVALVHQQYLNATEDEEWCDVCDLATGLSADELAPLLDGRAITVWQNETDGDNPNPGRIYMSPQWDEEHGLYFARVDNKWVQVDC
jgi:hypothetical protein